MLFFFWTKFLLFKQIKYDSSTLAKIKISRLESRSYMISGKKYDNQQIADVEAKYLNEYYTGSDPLLADSIEYYAILFQTYLHDKQDRDFEKLDKKQKEEVFTREDELFRDAMKYAFNKGHQTAFVLLLMNSKNAEEYDESFFQDPISKDVFIFNLEKLISEEVYNDNLRRSHIELLINYTRDNFENGFQKIMEFAKTFFKKGCEIAYMQIRRHIVGIEDTPMHVSRLAGVDLANNFTVTPAFEATFAVESPGFEEWDLHWDCTYGYKLSGKSVGTFLIHQFTVKEIKSYADAGAIAYKQMADYFSTNLDDDEIVYFGEIKFSLIDPKEDNMRFIQKSEYLAIQNALALTLQRKLGVDAKNILITT